MSSSRNICFLYSCHLQAFRRCDKRLILFTNQMRHINCYCLISLFKVQTSSWRLSKMWLFLPPHYWYVYSFCLLIDTPYVKYYWWLGFLQLGWILGLMASKLRQLQSKACQASQFVSKHGSVYYKQSLEQNKQYIQEPPTVEKCNLLAKQLFYTRLARFISALYCPVIRQLCTFLSSFMITTISALISNFPRTIDKQNGKICSQGTLLALKHNWKQNYLYEKINMVFSSCFSMYQLLYSDLFRFYAAFLVVMSRSGRNLTMSSTFGRTGRDWRLKMPV